MRKLLNTLYVSDKDCYLTVENGTVLVKKDDELLLRVPMINLESIITCGYKGASHHLMSECAKLGIAISFLTERGKFLGTYVGESRGNILLRKEQYRISDDIDRSCQYAKSFLFGKIYNARWVLERATRDYPLRVDVDKLKETSQELKNISTEIYACDDLDKIRLLEGGAAQHYFSCFNELILQNKSSFKFNNRNRRPPTDPINALLSLAYTLLSADCRGALETVGLDAYCGFLHRDRPGRASLALDLMEEFRACIADRFVISLINLKVLNADDFEQSESRAIVLTNNGMKKFFAAWQEHKREVITHPYLKEKLEWGIVPYSQSLLLARTIRGDLDEYPPFLWK